MREEKVENKALINKLLEINDGRFAISNLMKESQATLGLPQGGTSKAQDKKAGNLFKSQSSMISLNQINRKLQEEKI